MDVDLCSALVLTSWTPTYCRYASGVGRTYRYYNSSNPLGPPLFPFGAGLSYTTFTIEWDTAPVTAMCVDCGLDGRVELSAKVTNTGSRPGAKVVMAFVAEETPRHILHGERECGGLRCDDLAPHKSMFGMQKVHLEPGQSTVVHFPADIVPKEASGWCAFCTVSQNGTRLVAPGNYGIYVGGDGSMHSEGEVYATIAVSTRDTRAIEVPLMYTA
jgi:hypothetical protein